MDLFYLRRRSNRFGDGEGRGDRGDRDRGDRDGDREGYQDGRLSLQRLFVELSGADGRAEDNDDLEALHVLRRMLQLRDHTNL